MFFILFWTWEFIAYTRILGYLQCLHSLASYVSKVAGWICTLRTALRHGFSVLTATVAAGADGEASGALYPRQERASSPRRTIFRPNSAKFPKSQHEIISAWRRKLTAQLAKASKGWNRDERTCGGEASGGGGTGGRWRLPGWRRPRPASPPPRRGRVIG